MTVLADATTGLASSDLGDLASSPILVVDDCPITRKLIGTSLRNAGYQNISFAGGGNEALESVAKRVPDLLILDIGMPDIDGIELCRRLRLDPETRSVPILIESAHDTQDMMIKAFRAGASDMLSKPLRLFEVLARVRVLLEHRLMVRQLSAYRQRVAQELETARSMQQALCPTDGVLDEIRSRLGLRIDWSYEPCSELGGDMWHVSMAGADTALLFLADFSGHGVASAMNTFRLHTWLALQNIDPQDPAGLLMRLNEYLVDALPAGEFATVFLCCINPSTRTLTYSAAGSTPPLLASGGRDQAWELVESSGMPVGLRRGWRYGNRTVPFPEGGRLLLYSDALIESPCWDGTMIGVEGLEGRARDTRVGPEGFLETLLARCKRELAPPIVDDLTAVFISSGGEG